MTTTTMETTENKTGEFDAALIRFVALCQAMFDSHYSERYNGLVSPKLEIDPKGKKFVRIISSRRGRGESGRSVYCFVERSTGNILKAASWKAPAKHARGSIFRDDPVTGCCGPYGIVYLR